MISIERGTITMKKLIPILLAVFMLLGTQVVLGATALKVSASGEMGPAAYENISAGLCKIVNYENGTVNISGSTSTFSNVEQIGLTLNLQYYSSGKWVTLTTYNYNKYLTNYVSGGRTVSVSGGYNYRVYAQHTAFDGISNESGQSYSSTIYVQ